MLKFKTVPVTTDLLRTWSPLDWYFSVAWYIRIENKEDDDRIPLFVRVMRRSILMDMVTGDHPTARLADDTEGPTGELLERWVRAYESRLSIPFLDTQLEDIVQGLYLTIRNGQMKEMMLDHVISATKLIFVLEKSNIGDVFIEAVTHPLSTVIKRIRQIMCSVMQIPFYPELNDKRSPAFYVRDLTKHAVIMHTMLKLMHFLVLVHTKEADNITSDECLAFVEAMNHIGIGKVPDFTALMTASAEYWLTLAQRLPDVVFSN